MSDFIYLWIDALWLPIAYVGVHKKHRWWALGFVACSMLLVRLLAETMTHIGYEHGIMGFMTSNVYSRGIVVSSLYYALFLIMAHFSPNTKGVVFMAACLTLFFAIFVTAALVMLL